jgi:hypothetical protein
MIAIAADFSAKKHGDEKAFVEGLLVSLKDVAREKGWRGQRLVQAEWSDDAGALIIIDEGPGDVTVADVRLATIEAHRELRGRQAEGRLF